MERRQKVAQSVDEKLDDALDEKEDKKDSEIIADDKKEEDKDDETEEEAEGGEVEEEEEEEDEDEEIKEEAKPEPSLVTSLKKEFPTFAKKYPQIIDGYYQNKEYQQIFASTEDARIAANQADLLVGLLTSLDEGDMEPTLDVMYERDPEGLKSVITNFLPTINRKSPKLFSLAVTPVLRNVLAKIASDAEDNGNKDLITAVRLINHVLFRDKNVPEPVEFDKKARRSEEDDEERSTINQERFNNFYQAVDDIARPTLRKEIIMRLDPDAALPKGLRNTAVKQVMNRVYRTLRDDVQHMRSMAAMQNSAARNGFSPEYQKKIARTVVNAAKELLPEVLPKVKKRLLGDMKISETVKSERKPQGSSNRAAHEDKRAEIKKEPGDSIRDLLDKALPS